MKILLLWSSLFWSVLAWSQKSLEGGVLAGGLYYLGDLNPSTQFHSTNPGLGIFVRQNLNKRWAFRGNVTAGTLSASDKASTFGYQQYRALDFNTPLMELAVQAEFNFLSYMLGATRFTSPFTPYVAGGLGFALASNSLQPYNITIPFGVGIKWAVSKKLEFGMEWSFRKVFSDKLDNLSGRIYDLEQMNIPNQPRFKQNAMYYSDDWYSFAGIFVTYKIFQSGGGCKAYDF